MSVMTEQNNGVKTFTPVTRRNFLKTAGLYLPAFMAMPGVAFSVRASNSPEDLISTLFPDTLFMTRKSWAWTGPVRSRLNTTTGFERLTVHHEGTAPHEKSDESELKSHINNILSGHLEKGFGDMGYHFVIDTQGRIWEARSTRYEGAHVASANKNNLGVMLLGNFDLQQPSQEQVATLHKLIIAAMQCYEIPLSHIYGHCDLAASACPGKKLYKMHIAKFRQMQEVSRKV